MTAPQSLNDAWGAASQDGPPPPDGMYTQMSAHQRLDYAMRMADPNDPSKLPDPPPAWSTNRVGIPNPYGRGLKAYEPDTIIGQAYGEAKAAADAAKAEAAAKTPGTTTVDFGGNPLGDGTGKVAQAISAAMNLANRRVPYVWGGTTANGVDCSGLIYYAFNAAGIKMPRYRAQDLGHMGQGVSMADAKPGDIVYYDEPGDTDHVGLYIGNGQMIAAPQTGDVVKVQNVYGTPTSIRRLYSDDSLQPAATPSGAPGAFAYNGQNYTPWNNVTLPTSPGSAIQRVPGIHPVV